MYATTRRIYTEPPPQLCNGHQFSEQGTGHGSLANLQTPGDIPMLVDRISLGPRLLTTHEYALLFFTSPPRGFLCELMI